MSDIAVVVSVCKSGNRRRSSPCQVLRTDKKRVSGIGWLKSETRYSYPMPYIGVEPAAPPVGDRPNPVAKRGNGRWLATSVDDSVVLVRLQASLSWTGL
ncbi:hypothetical protein ZHAS_00008964 [Anopheles sinensis]|uniref:Uncharacterized protein n=1 Tax=Anopheles sinensis TaxID=74873 RepID=A0A084VTQ9_ANOSI|nr:hypothetical protein ZHAS_00008964 [Anopheles sinensis]